MDSYSIWNVDENGYRTAENKLPEAPGTQALLLSLWDEEKVICKGDEFIIPHKNAYMLDREELETLKLPDAYPFRFHIDLKNNITSQNLVYNISYFRDDANKIVNPVITGSFIRINSEEAYIFIKDQYLLIDEAARFNNLKEEEKNLTANHLAFARIHTLSSHSSCKFDETYKDLHVLHPKQFSVRLKMEDDSLIIEPVIEATDEVTSEFASQATSGLNDHIFRGRRMQNVIKTSPQTRVVIDNEQKKAVEKLAASRKMSGQKKREFLQAPEMLLAAEIFSLDDFSERVREIGEYKPRVFPFISLLKESWLPPECGLLLDDVRIQIKPKDAAEVRDRIKAAIQKGDPTITYEGHAIPASEETQKAVEMIIPAEPDETSRAVSIKIEKAKKNNTLSPLIYDNIEELDYSAGKLGEACTADMERLEIPSSLKRQMKLLQHQCEGLKWLEGLWTRGFVKGALLADDMGLGKTLQGFCFLAWLKEKMNAGTLEKKRFLITAPVALLDNWNSEYHRFFDTNLFGEPEVMQGPSLKYYIKNGRIDFTNIPEDALVLTTYETLRNYALYFATVQWAVIVLDEAQKIKNPTIRLSSAVKAMKYDFGLCMTGTPVENSWMDLWNIMDFANPGRLLSLKEFNAQFCRPLAYPETSAEELGEKLKDKIKDLMLRRLKSETIEGLPRKEIVLHKCEMSDQQLAVYINTVRAAKSGLIKCNKEKRKNFMLKMILALRDISLHKDGQALSLERLLAMDYDELTNGSARIEETFKILEDVQKKKEKAIIFLLSKKFQQVMKQNIEKRYGIKCLRPVNGDVAGGKRLEIINEFQKSPGFQVLILSPEAAGVGLNITAANHVIHLSRLWNPAKEDQATDRVYRLGQKKTVYVHLPLAVHQSLGERGSFDEKLDVLLSQKRRLSTSVLLPPVDDEAFGSEFAEELLGASVDGDMETEELQPPDMTIEVVDALSGADFERFAAALYQKQGMEVMITPGSNDYGADVIVHSGEKYGLLIQCKHAENPLKAMAPNGVQEVLASLEVYKKRNNRDYTGLVLTNAAGYTQNAQRTAQANNVQLLSRLALKKMLYDNPVKMADILRF
ncbi:MAG: SNF2-related protein [Cloacibacillus sp.]